jgi:hypothetical protein
MWIDTKVIEVLDSYISGFGRKDISDVNNSVYIAKELLGFKIPVRFNGADRLGVNSLDICGALRYVRPIRPNKDNVEAYEIGKRMSKYSSQELILMALFLWNEGKSTLYDDERRKARELLAVEFGYKK